MRLLEGRIPAFRATMVGDVRVADDSVSFNGQKANEPKRLRQERMSLPMHRTLETRHGPLCFGQRCLIMGILNVTPDSFSDGGRFLEPAAAIEHGLRMAVEGADLIDVGGESTRPGSRAVGVVEQIERVLPVIRGLRTAGLTLPISIDTQSAQVARAALDAGADLVNDISGVRHDPQMVDLLRESRVPFVVMHMQGRPETMQDHPCYEDVVAEVAAFLEERAVAMEAAGIDSGRMIIDPGIGFGKTLEHNMLLLHSLPKFVGRFPLMIGPSRKRFLRQLLGNVPFQPQAIKQVIGSAGDDSDASLLAGNLAVVLHAALSGADIIRVHDVLESRKIVEAVQC